MKTSIGASRIEALVGAISDFATRSRKWLPLPLHSQMPVEQQVGGKTDDPLGWGSGEKSQGSGGS